MRVAVALGVFVAALIVPAPTPIDAPVDGATGTNYQEPYSWGAVASGSSTIYGQYSAPLTGATALSTTAPAGGGTQGARVSGGAPVSKLAQMSVFGGGSALFFSKGGLTTTSGTHVLVAVQNTGGAHEVWGWGVNTYGQLGNGTSVSSQRPVKATWTAASGEQILSLAVGERHSLMLTLQGSTRRVYAWGSNGYGQVGGAGLAVASTTKQTTPLLLSVLTAENVQSVAAGRFHSAAADGDGEVWVWGYDTNAYGNLGLPGERTRYLPEKLTRSSMGQRSATITHYAIKNNLTTLTSSSYHYFEAGSTAAVSIGIPLLDGSKSVSTVANTSFTYTAQPNVASVAVPGGTASVTYSAPNAAVSSKRILNNSAGITVPSGHNYKAGNVVTVNLGDSDFDGSRTLTSVTATELRFESQPDVASTAASGSLAFSVTSASVTHKRVLSNEAILTLVAGHDLQPGNIVNVNIGDSAFDGTKTVTDSGSNFIKYVAQQNVASTAVSPAGSITAVTPTSAVVTNRVMSAPSGGGISTATLTVPPGHGFKAGNTIVVDIDGANEADFDGAYTVSAVGTSTISYTRSGLSSAVASGSTTGNVTLTPGTTTVSNKVIAGNVATLTVAAGHGLANGNVITVSGVGAGFDGQQTITNAAATTIQFTAQDDVATVAAPGTVTIVSPSVAITNKSITNNVATITMASGHGVGEGNTVVISGLGGNFDGTKVIANATATTATFTARSNVSATATTGTVTMTNPTVVPTNKLINANYATLVMGANHGFAEGNTITVAGLGGNFDGAKTITAIAATTITYKAQADVATTAISGSAVVTDCSGSCPTVPSGVLEVAAGNGFTLARTSTSVLSWGFTGTNNLGRIGRASSGATTPSAITLPAGCTPAGLAAGPYGGAVRCADNTVATWGSNGEGQLGTNTAVATASSATPTRISGMSLNVGETISSIDLGHFGGMVLTSTGRLFTWGSNKYRLLGNAKTYGAVSATAMPYSITAQLTTRIAPSGATIVAAAFEYATGFIADSNGAVWTWGWAGNGMTGRGVAGPTSTSTGSSFYPLGIASSARITHMDTTYWGIAVAMSDGSLWTMGSIGDSTGYYYNGDGTSSGRYLIGRIDLPFGLDTASPSDTITQLSCGTYHCLIATSAGKIYGWGDSYYRNVVINSNADVTTPTLIASGLVNPRIAAGTWYSLYVDIGAAGTGGTVYAYGANSLRRGVPQVSTSPLTSATAVQDMITPTGTPNDVVAISAGTAHSVALRADGSLMVWGSNAYGQLGNGNTTTTVYYSEPTLPGGRIAASVHAAGNHTIVRATDGSLVGWGSNLFGVLAGASAGNVTTPTVIASGYSFSQVDTYGYHTTGQVATAVGITTSGTVMSWGSNQYGQLGRVDRPAASSGANQYSATPVVVQTSDSAALVNADKVLATGYWGAAYRTLASPQVPSAPLSVLASSPAASTITVSWSAPATPNNLEGYIVEASRADTVIYRAGAGRSATSLTMAAPTFDILNGQIHTMRVYAVNEAGESVASGSATATPVGVPGIPQSLSVTPRLAGLRVSFATPVDLAGLPILDYEVVATPTSGGATTVPVPVGTSPYTVDIEPPSYSLTIGTSYVVTVRARNTEGFGLPATSSGVIPGRPTAPLNVTALGLSGSARVSWDAPTSDGGSAIQSYLVKVYADGSGTVLTSSVVNSGLAASMTATVTGLTNATTYEMTVTASQESAGTQYFGVESERARVTVGRPAAPTNVAAAVHNTPTGTQIRLTWTQVPDQTGLTITHYRWKHKVGSGAFTIGSAIATGTACSGTSCSAVVTGLTNGTTYAFVVEAAITGPNWGMTSAEVGGTPIGATSAPGVTTEALNGKAGYSITEPASLNGAEVTRYEVTYRPTAGGAWSSPAIEILPGQAIDPIEGLTNGTSYTISVIAVNAAGNSSAGTATVVPATTPDAPQNVRARPGSIIVTWDPPADTGGAAITSYVITVTDPSGLSTEYVYNGTSNPTGATSCTTGRSCTINSVLADDGSGSYVAITDDVEYTITVTAVTSAGQSPPSSDSVVVSGQPDAPTNVATTPGFESFDVCWTAPSGSLTKYKIVAVVGLARYERQFDASDPSPASCTGGTVGTTVTSWDDGSAVTAGTTYTLNVAATVSPSDYIFGLPSENVTVLPYGLPGAPTITEITTTATSATITWSAAANYGSAITGYVARTASGEACPSTVSLTCVISDLTGNATYSFTVVATNVAGDGPPSAAVNATIDATAPTPTWGSPTIGDSRRPSATGTFDEYVYFTLTFDEVATGFDATDLTNAGTATGCVFQRSTVVPNRSFNVSVVCASVGTLIARVKSGQVTDSAGNTGPSLNVDAALVTLNDPSSTTTTAAPTTTTIAATTTTAPISAASTSTTVGATTTSTTAPDGSAGSPGARADSGSTTTTLPSGGQGGGGNRSGGGSTTTTIGGGSGLPPGIDKKLDDDTGMVDEDPAAVGRPITIERCGFVPGEPVKLFVAGNLVRTATADENGCVEEEVTVPDAAGRKIVVALYAPKSKLGAKTTIAVVGSLAATGSDVDDFVVFGFGALLAGALLMSIPRRRRRR